MVNFPGTDHPVFYFERLPLANGKYVSYCTGVASLPYSHWKSERQLEEARELAMKIGWTCEIHREWSWHMVGETTLILFRRTTSHDEMTRIWQTSFKRWLYENKRELSKGKTREQRYAVQDILDCPHFPLDAESYEDCRNRYLKEFAPQLFHGTDESMAAHIKQLFGMWQAGREIG